MILKMNDDGELHFENESDFVSVKKNELKQFIESYQELEKENEKLKKQLETLEQAMSVMVLNGLKKV